jgi:hypothetical protein
VYVERQAGFQAQRPPKGGKKRDHDNVSSIASRVHMNHFIGHAAQEIETAEFLRRSGIGTIASLHLRHAWQPGHTPSPTAPPNTVKMA